MAANLVKREPAQSELALSMPAKDFLKEYSPNNCLTKFVEVKTPQLALKTDAPALCNINRSYGHKFLIGLISLNIINLCEYLGKKYAMSEQQISETSELIYTDNYYLTLADITLVFTQIKQGKRGGALYENINGRKIIECFAQYAAERAETACNEQLNREEIIKKHGYDKSQERASDDKLAEGILNYQMEAARREAQKELQDLNNKYHLQKLVRLFNNNKTKR